MACIDTWQKVLISEADDGLEIEIPPPNYSTKWRTSWLVYRVLWREHEEFRLRRQINGRYLIDRCVHFNTAVCDDFGDLKVVPNPFFHRNVWAHEEWRL